MKISMIAAMSSEGFIIGKDGRLPWDKISLDMKRFVQLTKNKIVVMGRRTLDDIGEPLKERVNVVLSRYPREERSGIIYAKSKEEVLELIHASPLAEHEVVIIGGEKIFRLFMEEAQILYITFVDGHFSGDTVFPEIDMNRWSIIEDKRVDSGEQSPYPLRFVTYKKLF